MDGQLVIFVAFAASLVAAVVFLRLATRHHD
jgi:hypothetical protein